MSSPRLALVFAFAAAIAAVAFFPLHLALAWSGAGAAGLSARSVEGSIWSGVLREASFHGAPLGALRVGLDPLGLLAASPRLRFAADGPVSGRGAAGFGRSSLRLDGADVATPLAFVVSGLPFRGRLQLQDATIRFQKGKCVAARGRVSIDGLGLGARGPDIPGLVLTGAFVCRDGVLALPLAGQGEGVRLDGAARIDGAGRYRLETRIRATNPTVEAALGLSGFGRTLDGFARVDQGRLGVHAGG